VDLSTVIRAVPDFPKPGILFRDITPVLNDPAAFRAALDGLAALVRDVPCDRLAALESRGFLFGAPLARQWGKGLVAMRKPGKLPADTISESYALEYGTATLEVHRDAIAPGERVLIVDDLLATGGTAAAAAALVRRLGGTVAGHLFLVELDGLGGRSRLAPDPVFSLVKFPEQG
jgi:adenine phosphoribosyltransferase